MKKKFSFMDSLNLAIIGKTGVGKSSLINYLFDEKELAETGSGKPVTKPGFHKFQKEISSKKYTVYDSFGLEPGKTRRWLNDFEQFMGPIQNSKEVRDWLHSCIYCISGASARLEPFEIEVINKLKHKELYPVVVITKADSKTAKELVNAIKNKTGIDPILVTSVEKSTFSGTIKPFGREELLDKLIKNSILSFKKRLIYMLERLETSLLKEVFETNFNRFKKYLIMEKDIFDSITKKRLDFIKNLFDELLQNDFENAKLKIEKKRNDALNFYKHELKFSQLSMSLSKDIDYDKYGEDLKIDEAILAFTIGLPIVLGLYIESLFTKKESISNILKGVKSEILKLDVVKSNRELVIYLGKKIDTRF